MVAKKKKDAVSLEGVSDRDMRIPIAMSGIKDMTKGDPEFTSLTKIAQSLVLNGFCINTGGSYGAENAARIGAYQVCELMESEEHPLGMPRHLAINMYLPHDEWCKNRPNDKYIFLPTPKEIEECGARDILEAHHDPNNIPENLECLFIRNYFVLHGMNNVPVKALIVFSDDGAETADEVSEKTMQAGHIIRAASRYNIPCINMSREGSLKRLTQLTNELINDWPYPNQWVYDPNAKKPKRIPLVDLMEADADEFANSLPTPLPDFAEVE